MNTKLTTAITAALTGGKEIMNIYQNADFGVEMKADNSPLTLADKAADKVIKQLLSETNIPILSEEGREIPYEERRAWQQFWLVDPLDGTKEFIKRNGEFTVNCFD
jgi:3'(2'), 5'-bisphosphate nucleotidase